MGEQLPGTALAPESGSPSITARREGASRMGSDPQHPFIPSSVGPLRSGCRRLRPRANAASVRSRHPAVSASSAQSQSRPARARRTVHVTRSPCSDQRRPTATSAGCSSRFLQSRPRREEPSPRGRMSLIPLISSSVSPSGCLRRDRGRSRPRPTVRAFALAPHDFLQRGLRRIGRNPRQSASGLLRASR